MSHSQIAWEKLARAATTFARATENKDADEHDISIAAAGLKGAALAYAQAIELTVSRGRR